MSEATPITDAAEYETYSEGGGGGELAVPPEVSRKLERQLNALLREVGELREQIIRWKEQHDITANTLSNCASELCDCKERAEQAESRLARYEEAEKEFPQEPAVYQYWRCHGVNLEFVEYVDKLRVHAARLAVDASRQTQVARSAKRSRQAAQGDTG